MLARMREVVVEVRDKRDRERESERDVGQWTESHKMCGDECMSGWWGCVALLTLQRERVSHSLNPHGMNPTRVQSLALGSPQLASRPPRLPQPCCLSSVAVSPTAGHWAVSFGVNQVQLVRLITDECREKNKKRANALDSRFRVINSHPALHLLGCRWTLKRWVERA
jgi:hypothetical protein